MDWPENPKGLVRSSTSYHRTSRFVSIVSCFGLTNVLSRMCSQDTLDVELLSQTANGDREAFATLAERHQAAIYRLVQVLTKSIQDAEDALQQTFLSAFRSAHTYRGTASVRTWLLTIARNAALRERKRAAVVVAKEESLIRLGYKAGWSRDNPETLAIRLQNIDALRAAIASLPKESAEILILRDLEGLSDEQTAKLLDISLVAAKSRLHRSRLKLAAQLRKTTDNKGGTNAR